MDSRTVSRLKIIVAALLFSTGGAAIKSAAFTSWQVACFRSGIAAVAVFVLSPASRRGWSWRTLVVGVTYAATLVLFVLANKLTTSANTIFLQSAAPLYLLLLGPWLLKEKITREDLFFMVLVGAGFSLFFVGKEAPIATAPNPFLGNVLAAISGLTWALTIVGLRWISARPGASESAAAAAVVSGNMIAFLVCLPFALPVLQGGFTDWALVSYLGVFQIGVAYIFLTTAIKRIPALEASVLLLVEPAFNPIWSWLVHGERPGPWALIGGVIIIGSTTAKAIYDARRAGPVLQPVE
ncbi:MAG: DMT family transporter [Gemmatimonadota bacterium]